MSVFADIEQFRRTAEAMEFADRWIKAQRADEVTSDAHMNLLAWTSKHPEQALGIILTLLDKSADDDDIMEQVALGPVEMIVEWPDDNFIPVLREAIKTHSVFELCTRSNRERAKSSRWAAL